MFALFSEWHGGGGEDRSGIAGFLASLTETCGFVPRVY
jgi:hypothetical protein